MPTENADAASPREKPPQFDLGCLLAVVAILCGVFTLIAPFLVDFHRNHWLIIGAVSGGGFLGIAVGVLMTYYPRYVVRKRSGALLLELPDHKGAPPGCAANAATGCAASGVGCEAVLLLLFGIPIAMYSFLFRMPTYQRFPLGFEHLLPIAGFAAAITAAGIMAAAPKLRPQFRERGVLVELKLTPWEKLTTARWSTLYPDVLRIGSYGVNELTVPAEDRDRVEAILCERCPKLFAAGEESAVD